MFTIVLVPFYRGAVVFINVNELGIFSGCVLVPFYRGAVVFADIARLIYNRTGSRPLLSRSGCILKNQNSVSQKYCSRPLLSRSGCISYGKDTYIYEEYGFSSPFIEERLYLERIEKEKQRKVVLVPFYRGAVVFQKLL